jgi:hypothetical protein
MFFRGFNMIGAQVVRDGDDTTRVELRRSIEDNVLLGREGDGLNGVGQS